MVNSNFIDDEIIAGFKDKKGPFEYTKLNSLLDGLNQNFKEKNQYVCAMLIRAIIDVTPPLLGLTTFKDVADSYSWSPTNKRYMMMLLDFKNEGDGTLHTVISRDKDFLDMEKITVYKNKVNIFLQECLKKGGQNELMYANSPKKTSTELSSKIKITLTDDENDGWQNYSFGLYMGYSFKFVLNVDNYNSNKPDYLTPFLKATDAYGDPWLATNFIFETQKSALNLPFKVEAAEEILGIKVILSDQEFSHTSSNHRFKPNLDKNSLVLHIRTKSGRDFELPIKANII